MRQWRVIAGDESDDDSDDSCMSQWRVIAGDESDDDNDVLIGCLRGDVVGIQYYRGMVP